MAVKLSFIARASACAAALAVATTTATGQQPGPDHGGRAGHHAAQPAAVPPGADDDRQAVVLTSGERDFVLHEMRQFLVSIEGIVSALAADKPAAAAEAARVSGMGTREHVPRSLMMKMPGEWRRLGMDTHSRFDALAMEAASMGDRTQLLGQLSGLLANCTGCHARYKLVTE
ncbi:MAG: hypothetical protein ACK4MF_06660 [Hyphomicrobiaceae bacterium]